ncbi:MAG: hypothetical protein CVV27_12350 [Candidatus Melainabacteria bacterium HGW-Melainabacteria-1]|nr:MAG: hypothetical protein CVV27_12350 [Candidatus Melainabacteria bacterium HGW-Melainabacteria-1]
MAQAPTPPSPAPNSAPQPGNAPGSKEQKEQLDDFVPDKVGNVVDNVFGKLDNLVNDAADYLFGNKKKAGGLLEGDTFAKTQAPTGVPPLVKGPQAPPPIPKPEVKPLVTPGVPPLAAASPVTKAPPPKVSQPVKTLSTLQGARTPEMIRPVLPESKPSKAAAKYDGPIISRTTSISELDLPLEILDDPDLPRYFDQMKLYEAQAVEGGLCNLPQFEASMVLRKGKWKHDFGIAFEQLKNIQPGINPMEMAKSRFFGMRPVYKAQAHRFANQHALIDAIETDINTYLAGKQGKGFHPFIYQVVSTVIR